MNEIRKQIRTSIKKRNTILWDRHITKTTKKNIKHNYKEHIEIRSRKLDIREEAAESQESTIINENNQNKNGNKKDTLN